MAAQNKVTYGHPQAGRYALQGDDAEEEVLLRLQGHHLRSHVRHGFPERDGRLVLQSRRAPEARARAARLAAHLVAADPAAIDVQAGAEAHVVALYLSRGAFVAPARMHQRARQALQVLRETDLAVG